MTFGLDTWDLSYFNQILVFPNEYQNPKTKNYHKGETNLGGFMCFSWEDFLAGNRNPTDKINLGLHEFAHALRFNGIKGDESDYFFENYFARWFACARKEYIRMRHNRPSIFRKYGAVNINEFFSVAIETFFETPKEFKAYFPALYIHTSILLNQTFKEDGAIWINCREKLLSEIESRLINSYTNSIIYRLKSRSLVPVCGFTIAGLIAMPKEGYRYPLPYICFLIAGLFWLYFEKNYTRLLFDKNQFKINKGFLFLEGYKKITLPLSSLISVTVNYSYVTPDNKQLNNIVFIYYSEGFFYEEKLNCTIRQPEFDLLCEELRQNFVHVFIR